MSNKIKLSANELVAVSLYLIFDLTKEQAFEKSYSILPTSSNSIENASAEFWEQDKIKYALKAAKSKLQANTRNVNLMASISAQMTEDVREMFKQY